MTVIKTAKKGQYLNNSERYHIQNLSKQNLHMNDTHIKNDNSISEILYKYPIR